MSLVSRLLEILVILWTSVKKALERNEEAQKYTFAKFGSVLSKYFQTFEVLKLHVMFDVSLPVLSIDLIHV